MLLVSLARCAVVCVAFQVSFATPQWRQALEYHLPSIGGTRNHPSNNFDLLSNSTYPVDTKWDHVDAPPSRFGCLGFGPKSEVHTVRDGKKDDNSWAVANVIFTGGKFFLGGADVTPRVARVSITNQPSLNVSKCSDDNTLRETWYVTEFQTSHNMYHAHNNNILPLYRALAMMNDTNNLEAAWIADLLQAAREDGQQGASPDAGSQQRVARELQPQKKPLPAGGACGREHKEGDGDLVTLVAGPYTQKGKDLVAPIVKSIVPRIFTTLAAANEFAHTKGGGTLCLERVFFGRMPRVFTPYFPLTMGYATEQTFPRYRLSQLTRLGMRDIIHRTPKWPPRAVFILRQGTRTMAKESKELLQQYLGYHGVSLELINPGALSLPEQMKMAANTDILIGVHGAGLALVTYMKPGSVALQIRPCNLNYWEDALFTKFAILNDVDMLGYQEQCKGKEGWNKRDVDFRNAKKQTDHHIATLVSKLLLTYVKRHKVRDAAQWEESH